MNFYDLLTGAMVERLGWVLVHTLWQFLVAASVGAVVLHAMRRHSAAGRARVLSVLLVLMLAMPVATWMVLPWEGEKAALAGGGDPGEAPRMAGVRPVERGNAGVPEGSGAGPIEVSRVEGGGALEEAAPMGMARDKGERPWLGWAVGCWGAGVMVCSLRPVAGWLMLRRLKRVGVSPAPAELEEVLVRLSGRLGWRRRVRVWQSRLARVPMVAGYFRPVILMPVSVLAQMPANQLEAILAHELAHIRRHDFLMNLVQVLIETLFFYHPGAWWLSHRLRVEREYCCDDLAVEMMNNRLEYGRALVAVEAMCGGSTLLAPGAGDGSLVGRIRRLAGAPGPGNAFSACAGGSLLVGLIVFTGIVMGIGKKGVAAMEEQTGPPATSPAMVIPAEKGRTLAEAVRAFNAENRLLGRGQDQPPLTEEEVVAAVRNTQKFDSHEVGVPGERALAAFKEVAQTRRLPEGSYFQVWTSESPDPLTVVHLWRIMVYIPARERAGMMGFTIRDKKIGEEKIDPKSIAWGKADAQGLSLGLYLMPRKEKYALGERVQLKLFVRNDGAARVEGMTFHNITWPRSGDFTVVDEMGEAVAVREGHEEWSGPGWVAGATAGGLEPGAVHAFRVPFELGIGGGETNKLVGRVVDVHPGQTVNVRVRALNGNSRRRAPGEPNPETGGVTFGVVAAEAPPAATAAEEGPAAARIKEAAGPLEVAQPLKATAGEPAFRLAEHGVVVALGFADNGRSLVSATWEKAPDRPGLQYMLRTWELTTRGLVKEVELQWENEWTRQSGNMILSKDRTRFLATLGAQVGIWDVASGKLLRRLELPPELQKDARLSALACTADFSRIIAGRSRMFLGGLVAPDGHVVVWDGRTGEVVRVVTVKQGDPVRSMGISADGGRVATLPGRAWDVASGAMLVDFRNENLDRKHPDPEVKPGSIRNVWVVGLSPDGNVLATCDMIGIKLIDVETGRIVRRMDAPHRYSSGDPEFAFSADGRMLALMGVWMGEKNVPIWNTQTGALVACLPMNATAGAFSEDGHWFAAGRSDAREAVAVWRVAAGDGR